MMMMINFSINPLQSDVDTLMSLSQKDEQLLKALDKSDVARINGILEKSNLVPKMVLVHGKNGTYWATRMVNPNTVSSEAPAASSQNASDDTVGTGNLKRKRQPGYHHSKGAVVVSRNTSSAFVPVFSSKVATTQQSKTNSATTIKASQPEIKWDNYEPDAEDKQLIDTIRQSTQAFLQKSPHIASVDKVIITKGNRYQLKGQVVVTLKKLYTSKWDINREFPYSLDIGQEHFQWDLPNKPNTLQIQVPFILWDWNDDKYSQLSQKAAQQHFDSLKAINLPKDLSPQLVKLFKSKGIAASEQDKSAINFIKGLSIDAKRGKVISKISSVEQNSSEYKEVVSGIQQSWGKFGHLNVQGIYRIDEMPMDAQYQKIVQKNSQYSGTTVGGKNCHKDMFFHGTDFDAVSSILGYTGSMKTFDKNNADDGVHGANVLGDGIYLASDSWNAAQYTDMTLFFGVGAPDTWMPDIDKDGFATAKGALLVCEASLGRTINLPEVKNNSHRSSDEENYEVDAVFGDENLDDPNIPAAEYCVKNPQAVRPKYIVDVQIKVPV